MADLGPTQPATTYPFLLQVPSGVDPTTLRGVQDGMGRAVALQLSGGEARATGKATYASGVTLGTGTASGCVRHLPATGNYANYDIRWPSGAPGTTGLVPFVYSVASGVAQLAWGTAGGAVTVYAGS